MAHHYCIRNQRSHLDLSASGRRKGEGGRVGDVVAERAKQGGNGSAFTKLAFCKLRRRRRLIVPSIPPILPPLSLPLSQMPARLQKRWPLPVMECLPVECHLFPSFPSFARSLSLSLFGELFPSNNGKRKHKSRLGRGWGVTAGGATEAGKDRARGKGWLAKTFSLYPSSSTKLRTASCDRVRASCEPERERGR